MSPLGVHVDLVVPVDDGAAVGRDYFCPDREIFERFLSRDLGLYAHRCAVSRHIGGGDAVGVWFVVGGGDVYAMAVDEQVLVGGYHLHVAIQSAACVPSRVHRLPCVSYHEQFVGFAIFQQFSHVYFKAEVSVVGASDAMSVEEHVAHQHYSAEVEDHAFSFQ